MNAAEENGPERESDDLIAAEYVLGVLSADERLAVGRRVEAESAFARLVEQWALHLSPMDAAYPSVEAPSSVKAALDRKLFASATPAARSTGSGAGIWSSLAFWRGLTLASLAALALAVAIPAINPPAQAPQTRLVASLAAEGTDVHYLALYDAAQGDVALSHVSGARAEGRDFELWMIEGGNAPVSMGVIPVGTTAHITIGPDAMAKLASGAVLAVSLEPSGGSPTGQPTGPVVAAGDLKSI